MVESRSIVSGPDRFAGPAPQAHKRASSSRLIASYCRTLDHLCARSQLPTVDGARVASNSSPAAPARRTATSSMLSPPASIDPTTVSALVPLFAPCRARCSRPSISPPSPSRSARSAAGTSPAFGTRFVSSKFTDTRLNSCDARTLQVPFHPADMIPSARSSSQVEGHLRVRHTARDQGRAVDPGLGVSQRRFTTFSTYTVEVQQLVAGGVPRLA